MGAWLLSGTILALSLTGFKAPVFDFSNPVHDQADYLSAKQEIFLTERIEEFNQQNNSELTIVVTQNIGDHKSPSDYSRYLFRSDSRVRVMDRRILVLLCVQIVNEHRGELSIFIESGEGVRKELTIDYLAALKSGVIRSSKSSHPVYILRNVVGAIFARVDPGSNSDVASANLAAIHYPYRKVYWYRTSKQWKMVHAIIALALLGDLAYKLQRRNKERLGQLVSNARLSSRLLLARWKV